VTIPDGMVFIDRPAGRVYYLAFDGILASAPIRVDGFSLLEGRAVEPPETARHSEIRSALEQARFGGVLPAAVHEIRVRRDGLPQLIPDEDD
jgi:hypothetical protein